MGVGREGRLSEDLRKVVTSVGEQRMWGSQLTVMAIWLVHTPRSKLTLNLRDCPTAGTELSVTAEDPKEPTSALFCFHSRLPGPVSLALSTGTSPWGWDLLQSRREGGAATIPLPLCGLFAADVSSRERQPARPDLAFGSGPELSRTQPQRERTSGRKQDSVRPGSLPTGRNISLFGPGRFCRNTFDGQIAHWELASVLTVADNVF